LHFTPRTATEAYNRARGCTARFLNASSDQEVVFTYGTTSSINLLAQSFGDLLRPGDEVLVSVLEHHSNLLPWQQLAARRRVVLPARRVDTLLECDRRGDRRHPRGRGPRLVLAVLKTAFLVGGYPAGTAKIGHGA
jgi:selenocysteine lyase/cysteine desulfurase